MVILKGILVYPILLILSSSIFIPCITFGDNNIPPLNNWIIVKDNGMDEQTPFAEIRFDEGGKRIFLNAEVKDSGQKTTSFFDIKEMPSNNKLSGDCDFSGGWVGTTDQGKELIFLVSNGIDITRIEIEAVINSPFCNKSFGTGLSDSVGMIVDNRFSISDIVVCGTRLGVSGEFTSCEEIEGRWFFYCPSCGSASRRWRGGLDNFAPSKVSDFDAVAGDAQVSLSWENPPDKDLKGVRIQRSLTGPPVTPQDGLTVFNGFGSKFEDTCVSNGKEYFYTIFAFDKVSNFSPGVSLNVVLE